MLQRQSRRRHNSGFSLIEILVVMVIIGILVSLVAPSVLNRVDDARLQKVEADFKSIESALSIYHLDNFNYPSTDQGLQALVSKPDGQPEARNWKKGGYLKEMPMDPWGREYLYLSPGEDGRDFDLYTLGADGVTGGEEQNADLFSGDVSE
jgi:general secretion pathway protein G